MKRFKNNQNALIEAPNGTQRVERILKPIQEWISSQEESKHSAHVIL